VYEVIPVLRDRLAQQAGSLSGGEQQMLSLAQAFIAKPKLLMIDELSLGLAPVVVQQLLEIVKDIHARGTTIILVEQSVNVALTVAEHAYFMEKGQIRFDGPTSELLKRGDILRSVFLEGAQAVVGTTNGSKSRRRTKR
jgi:branched-chain amino acid transport system ATP-binding protein